MDIFGIDLGVVTGQTAIIAIVSGGLGVAFKSILEWTTGRRKQYLDQLQIALSELKIQQEQIDKLRGQISNLHKEVRELSVLSTRLTDYVDILEQQLVKAGQTLITPSWKRNQQSNLPEKGTN